MIIIVEIKCIRKHDIRDQSLNRRDHQVGNIVHLVWDMSLDSASLTALQ